MRLEMISSESRGGLRLTASMQAEHPLASAPRRTGPPSTAKRDPANARWLAGSLVRWLPARLEHWAHSAAVVARARCRN